MVAQVPPQGLSAWFAQHTGEPLIIDVREAHEVAVSSVSLPGVAQRNLPMSTFTEHLAELDPRRPTALLCAAGMRSQRVAMFLEAQGFDAVANISGGVSAWTL